MEMFENYFAEEYGRKCFKNEFGFCFYQINGEEFYIVDFYIKPEHRATYEGKKLFSKMVEFAREYSCKFISAIVQVEPIKADKAQRLLKCYLWLGFKPFSTGRDSIVLAYDLKEN